MGNPKNISMTSRKPSSLSEESIWSLKSKWAFSLYDNLANKKGSKMAANFLECSDVLSHKPFRIFILVLGHQITRCWLRNNLITTGVLERKYKIDFKLTSTCEHSCCRKDKDKGYISGSMYVIWWDHSYSYDNSYFQLSRVGNRLKLFFW